MSNNFKLFRFEDFGITVSIILINNFNQSIQLNFTMQSLYLLIDDKNTDVYDFLLESKLYFYKQ